MRKIYNLIISMLMISSIGIISSCKKEVIIQTVTVRDTVKIVVPPPTPPIDSLTIGLIAYYPFDNSGVDVSGNGNHGLINNMTGTSDRTGKANAAYHFDGSTSYIQVKDNQALRLNGTDYTINTWEKIESYGPTYGSIIMCKRGNGNSNGWNYGIHGYVGSNNAVLGQTTMQISGGNDPTATGTKVINLNAWYMLTTVYNAQKQQISFYVNGVLDNVISNIPAPSVNASSDIFIGSDNPTVTSSGYFFKGSLDDMRIYGRALTLKEIQKLYTYTGL
jgi:hypothetical protein